jgi:predicted permease
MRTLVQDVALALRMLSKAPGPGLIVVVTLGLGIGANTAIFTVVNAVSFRPLPFSEAHRLVQLERTWPESPTGPTTGLTRSVTVSVPKFLHWRDHSRVFEAVTASRDLGAGYNLTGDDHPERLAGLQVTNDFFSVFAVHPVLGRAFRAEEDRPGAARVIVLSQKLWRRRFGSDPSIVGQQLLLDGDSFTVVGVMPRGFSYPPATDFWTPLQLDTASQDPAHVLLATGRLRPGVSVEEANAEMSVVGKQFLARQGRTDTTETAGVEPLHEVLYGDLRPAFRMFSGAAFLVLLVACANVVNLRLARSVNRQREVAVRRALGASSSRILRMFLTESVLLSVMGGLLALLLCSWVTRPLLALAPVDLWLFSPVSVDASVLAFAFGVTVLAGLLTGLGPALAAVGADVHRPLREAPSRVAGSRDARAARMTLVAGEIALTLMVVVGATLLTKSFARLMSVESGIEPGGVLTMKLPLSESEYVRPAAFERIHRELLPAVEGLAGVQAAAAASSLPLEPGVEFAFIIEGRHVPGTYEGAGEGEYRAVSPGFFETLGIPLLRGRLLTDHDDTNAQGVVIINDTAARRYWPNQSPLGQRITIGPPQFPEIKAPRVVVGVVGDVRARGLAREPPPILYVPLSQYPQHWARLLVKALPLCLMAKAERGPDPLRAAIQERVSAFDPNQPVTDVQPMERVVLRSLGSPRFNMVLMSLFAGLALVLASVGSGWPWARRGGTC